MRATAVAGADRWFGLIGRFVDATHYYYLTVRSDNTISLRKLTNDGITTLDTASLPFTLNAWRTLRLEIVNNKLRGYVDDRLVVEAVDATPHAAGRYGVGSYKTAAEADDFRVTQP